MNEIETLNRTLFLSINGGDNTPTWLVQTAIVIADDLIYLIPLLLLGLWLWGDHTRRSLALKECMVTLCWCAPRITQSAQAEVTEINSLLHSRKETTRPYIA